MTAEALEPELHMLDQDPIMDCAVWDGLHSIPHSHAWHCLLGQSWVTRLASRGHGRRSSVPIQLGRVIAAYGLVLKPTPAVG